MIAPGASVHLDLLFSIKHDNWCIYLPYNYYLTGLGRCHFYIRMAIGGPKSQHLQLSSRPNAGMPSSTQRMLSL
jgi:hypothetical protein